jgi:hypothetical protein
VSPPSSTPASVGAAIVAAHGHGVGTCGGAEPTVAHSFFTYSYPTADNTGWRGLSRFKNLRPLGALKVGGCRWGSDGPAAREAWRVDAAARWDGVDPPRGPPLVWGQVAAAGPLGTVMGVGRTGRCGSPASCASTVSARTPTS